MRLFTALWVPPDAAAALLAEAGPPPEPPGWRATDPAGWHLTLAFHGEADPGILARRLEAAARLAPAPRLALHGAGAFPGVRWAAVAAEPAERLAALVDAAGGDRATFVPHVTVLRRRTRPGPGADPDPPAPWSGHRGAPWWPADVLLVRSETARRGPRYRVVHRVPLEPAW